MKTCLCISLRRFSLLTKRRDMHKIGRGKYQRIKPISSKEFTKEVLLLFLKAGGMLTLTALCGSHPQALVPLVRFTGYSLRKLRFLIKRLERQRYLVHQKKGRQEFICLTKEGEQRAAWYRLPSFYPTKGKKWDGKWRVIFFDVPNEAHSRRNFLRRELKYFGCVALQKSVFVTPYSCKEFLEVLEQASGLKHCLIYLETFSLGIRDVELRKHFGLEKI